MAESRARVALAGRFPPGARVRLVEVAGEHVLRTSPADRTVQEKVVDESGHVEFTTNVTDGGRYFVVGQKNGQPLEVRVRGRVPDSDTDAVNSIAPVGTEPRRFSSGGGDVDEAPEDAVRAAEDADRVRKAGPAGSDSALEEEAAIRKERAQKAAEEREEAEKGLSDEEKVGARNERAQTRRAPRATNDNLKGA